MPETVNDLIADVRSFVDADAPSVLRVFNRRYIRMVTVARSLRKQVQVTLVDGQAFYPLTALGIVEVLGVSVNGAGYGRARRDDKFADAAGTLRWSGPGGLVAVDANTAGATGLTVIPTPGTGTLELYSAIVPADVTGSEDVSTLPVDRDFHEALINGTASTFLKRQGEGNMDAEFDAACLEMRARMDKRFRGSSPGRIRMIGVNA